MYSKLLLEVEELLSPIADLHKPEGTECIAVVDQWIHAIASQFFCNADLAPANELKTQIIDLLSAKQLFTNRENFYDLVLKTLP